MPNKICFDFDGVMVRSRHEDKTFLWSMALAPDLNFPMDLRATLFALPHWHDIVTGKKDFRDRLDLLFRDADAPCSVDTFVEYWLEHDLNWYDEIVTIARDAKARGAELYVTSNQDRLRSAYLRRQPLVQDLFNAIVTSSDLGVAKPDPLFFRKAFDVIGAADGDRPILIDDDSRNVAAAIDAGWTGIYFNPDLDPAATPAVLRNKLFDALA